MSISKKQFYSNLKKFEFMQWMNSNFVVTFRLSSSAHNRLKELRHGLFVRLFVCLFVFEA